MPNPWWFPLELVELLWAAKSVDPTTTSAPQREFVPLSCRNELTKSFFFTTRINLKSIPSWELRYPHPRYVGRWCSFFPRWDILVSWRVFDTILPNNLSIEATFVGNHWATNMFRYHVQAILGIGFPYIAVYSLAWSESLFIRLSSRGLI